ncbi:MULTISPECIES: Rieske (2Fe-2S) protein [unclassified Modestobacter]|uniref:Rieske (2Fe-2S) protein n=1 Tax=unclassified Modestobacter TaxID=2643866 RepID=UPI0022AA8849|nr:MULTISPECIES: Rieske (2Fe-2S) protein [unclassified Modestobacter]MCZ2825047.1 Rieske (2Fe-2S) protein [Modestobacter sp. VKM Ac-2981]MCZ2854450.1 Rieske (2Fe-2S) protein [Modestobacter sp. VKM Ac-2982]
MIATHSDAPGAPTSAPPKAGTPATEVTDGAAAGGAGVPHVVGRVDDVPPGEGRAFVAGDVQVAVFRLRDGSLHATQAACPHSGGPLADGQTDATVLVCPLHLYAFRWSDGTCTSTAPPVRLFPVSDQDGALVVTV